MAMQVCANVLRSVSCIKLALNGKDIIMFTYVNLLYEKITVCTQQNNFEKRSSTFSFRNTMERKAPNQMTCWFQESIIEPTNKNM